MMARELVLCCIIAFAARVSGDWNVNVGSNINTAPSVVNDPLLDFGALYVNDYAQHRVVECFYNGTCRDFVQKGAAASSGHGDSTSDTMTTAVPNKQAGMTVTSSTLPVRARQASFCTMLPTASSKSRPSATFQEPHVLS